MIKDYLNVVYSHKPSIASLRSLLISKKGGMALVALPQSLMTETLASPRLWITALRKCVVPRLTRHTWSADISEEEEASLAMTLPRTSLMPTVTSSGVVSAFAQPTTRPVRVQMTAASVFVPPTSMPTQYDEDMAGVRYVNCQSLRSVLSRLLTRKSSRL